jgi:hypothetical protein
LRELPCESVLSEKQARMLLTASLHFSESLPCTGSAPMLAYLSERRPGAGGRRSCGRWDLRAAGASGPNGRMRACTHTREGSIATGPRGRGGSAPWLRPCSFAVLCRGIIDESFAPDSTLARRAESYAVLAVEGRAPQPPIGPAVRPPHHARVFVRSSPTSPPWKCSERRGVTGTGR